MVVKLWLQARNKKCFDSETLSLDKGHEMEGVMPLLPRFGRNCGVSECIQRYDTVSMKTKPESTRSRFGDARPRSWPTGLSLTPSYEHDPLIPNHLLTLLFGCLSLFFFFFFFSLSLNSLLIIMTREFTMDQQNEGVIYIIKIRLLIKIIIK